MKHNMNVYIFSRERIFVLKVGRSTVGQKIVRLCIRTLFERFFYK